MLLSLSLCCLFSPALRAAEPEFPAEKAKWRYLRSENFELYCSAGEQAAEITLRDLETLRALFLELLKVKQQRPIPVSVYVFGRENHYRSYLPEDIRRAAVTGVHLAHPDRTTIMLTMAGNYGDTRQTVRHEFIHHLFRVVDDTPPLWYNEGVAELLSTIAEEKGKLVLGRPPVGRLIHLQAEGHLPVEQLFAESRAARIFRSDDHAGRFYSQAWLLTHFCYFGVTDVPREQAVQFLAAASAPEIDAHPQRLAAVAQQYLGMDLKTLDRRLESYALSGKYGSHHIAIPKVQAPRDYVRRDVPRDEMRVRLAELMARLRKDSAAELVLMNAVERDPANSRVQEVLGTLSLMRHDETGMMSRWKRALAGGSVNPAVAHEYLQQRTRTLFLSFDPHYRMPVALAEELRDLVRRSIQAAPEQCRMYEALAWIEASTAQPDIGNLNLVQTRFATLKEQPRTLVALAAARHRLGMDQQALKLLDSLATFETDAWSTDAAEQLRAKIERRPSNEELRNPREKGASRTGAIIRLSEIAAPDGE
jgi:hypothetical protein